jgi:hypothetical protein
MADKKLIEVCLEKSEKRNLGGSLNSALFQDVCRTALEYRAMLESLEWSVIADYGNASRCPSCKCLKTAGHSEYCKLQQILKQ